MQEKKNNKGLVGILLIALVVLGYVFFVRPMAADVGTAKADLVVKESEIVDLEAKLDQFQGAEKQLELATEVQRLEILKAVPVGINQDEIIRDLIEITDVNDITLNSLSFGQGGSGQEGVGSVRINAGFEGNYSDLIDFLRAIERNARLFQVQTISAQVNPSDFTGLTRVNFALSIDAFYQL